jgi:hypothetical protein
VSNMQLHAAMQPGFERTPRGLGRSHGTMKRGSRRFRLASTFAFDRCTPLFLPRLVVVPSIDPWIADTGNSNRFFVCIGSYPKGHDAKSIQAM